MSNKPDSKYISHLNEWTNGMVFIREGVFYPGTLDY